MFSLNIHFVTGQRSRISAVPTCGSLMNARMGAERHCVVSAGLSYDTKDPEDLNAQGCLLNEVRKFQRALR